MDEIPFDKLLPAVFIQRDNRFRAEIELNGQRYKAHVANSGRMKELLTPMSKIWVHKAEKETRKTHYDLVLVEHEGRKICLNAQMANHIFAFWLEKQLLPEFSGANNIKREYSWGNSRFDFKLELNNKECLLEIKSVNLVRNGIAYFPDAPTERGVKHLQELTGYQKQGGNSFVVFIVMGNDASSFLPNETTDALFTQALRQAQKMGVTILVYKAIVEVTGVTFGGRIAF